MEEPGPTSRWRKPLIYTVVVVVLAAIGATAVFLLGSANRRSDRNAVVVYQRAILPLVREANHIIDAEIPGVIEALQNGQVPDDRLARAATDWQGDLERIRSELLALTPPVLLGGVEEGFSVMMGAYLLTVDAVADIAGAAPDQRATAIDTAVTFGERARGFYDDVAAIIQFHRRRLGLGDSPELHLPEPAPTFTS